MRQRHHHHHPAVHRTKRDAKGFSLVEVIFALLLVGLVYVAAIDTLGAARANQARTHDHAVAFMLAQERMSQLLIKPYGQLDKDSETELDDRPGWSRTVEVDHVNADEPETVAGSDTGVRRVRVTVSRGNAQLAELVTLRTRGMPSLPANAEAIGP
ncbi:prepilin-type N-terminal cleavage/methylation domain-containing protein [Phycisphaerales bacterium AB-hyl4]|uniref:Prepilin-type N-terminal cleavage/methylation domain-containing protein n=1 Tax=Natronomicrosphaera hydrolytica TaxID=3242702 RepID=A0ABV4U193_9BACT